MEKVGNLILQIYSSLYRNRELIWEMALRELKMKNKGSFLGYLWLLLGPLIQVVAYVLIVALIFKTTTGENPDSFSYVLYVLSGMIPWQIITRSLQDSPTLIIDRMDLVKQVIYPIETLPLTTFIITAIGASASLCVFLGLAAVTGNLSWGLLFLPIPLILLFMLVVGMSWIFSIVGIFVKDLREIVTVILGLLVYFSPVILTPQMVGERMYSYILIFNPFSHVIISFRDVFYWQFHLVSWVMFLVLAIGSFLVGGWIISRTKILINQYI